MLTRTESPSFSTSKSEMTGQTFRDVFVLPKGQFLAIDETSLRYYTKSGDELYSLDLSSAALSIGSYGRKILISCFCRKLLFVSIQDGFRLLKESVCDTAIQYSSVTGYGIDDVLAIGHEIPVIHKINVSPELKLKLVMCIPLTFDCLQLNSFVSMRRIHVTGSGMFVISDERNNFLFACTKEGNTFWHNYECPNSITSDKTNLYISQGGGHNRVLRLDMNGDNPVCLLTSKDGVVNPCCLSVNNSGLLLVGLIEPEPKIKAFLVV